MAASQPQSASHCQPRWLSTLGDKLSDSAENLAAFRIVVGVLLLGCADLWQAVAVARLPPSLRTSSTWLGTLLLQLPISDSVVSALAYLICGLGFLIAIGLWTRLALILGTLCTLYVLGVAQLGGAVWHCHHVLWFCALLCISPCADVWSVDALLRSRKNQTQYNRYGLCYGLPIRIGWLLLAAIFVFPGLWKLRGSGLAWIVSDNLRSQLHWKWVQSGGYLPWLRVDRFPLLCKLLAASVVGFELGFPLLLFHKRLRLLLIGLALLFHLGTWLLMQISFSILWPCYAILVDWKQLWARLQKWRKVRSTQTEQQAAHGQESDPVKDVFYLLHIRNSPTAVMGFLLILGVFVSGLMGWTQSYPFACYPTFQHLATDSMPALLVSVESLSSQGKDSQAQGKDSQAQEIELPRPWTIPSEHSARSVALMWSVLRQGNSHALAAYGSHLRTIPQAAAVMRRVCPGRLHFDRGLLPVRPEAWQTAPQQRTRLGTLPLTCPVPSPP